MLAHLADEQQWDILVIGGGATGLGIAVDASLRGYQVLLLEGADFGKGTSSRSTKLVHGGVRYLAQGDIWLVLEALRERGLLLQNAPHLTHDQSFVIPVYSWWDAIFYSTGLFVYDLLAGNMRLGAAHFLGKKKVIEALQAIKQVGLKGGVVYHDGQFDDARLLINLAQSAADEGAFVLNYTRVTGLSKDANGRVIGVEAIDLESQKTYAPRAKVIINATGVFVDDILKMDKPSARPIVRPSQGVHVVLDRSFLPGDSALMIPKTSDGRVLFALPWHNKVVVGTTDTLIDKPSLEPKALEEEITFILETAGAYLNRKPNRADVLSVFAGLRPLAASYEQNKQTKELSRSHKLVVSESGLVTITGGKWTTYRQMAEDTVDEAIKVGHLPQVACATQHYHIHGYQPRNTQKHTHLAIYGADQPALDRLIQSDPSFSDKLHPDYPYLRGEVIWAARFEMARTVEDVLARRIRILFLDARAAIEMSREVAQLLSRELKHDSDWVNEQLNTFTHLAQGFLINGNDPIKS